MTRDRTFCMDEMQNDIKMENKGMFKKTNKVYEV